MDDKLFFTYYLPALKQALLEDHIIHNYPMKEPSDFYPIEVSLALSNYEDIIYNKYPLLDIVEGYFDYENMYNPDYGEKEIERCRNKILTEMNVIANKFKIDIKE